MPLTSRLTGMETGCAKFDSGWELVASMIAEGGHNGWRRAGPSNDAKKPSPVVLISRHLGRGVGHLDPQLLADDLSHGARNSNGRDRNEDTAAVDIRGSLSERVEESGIWRPYTSFMVAKSFTSA